MTATATRPTAAAAKISLFDRNGQLQTTQFVTVREGRVSFGDGVVGGDHIARFPVALCRRIALDWVLDGADRSYSGFDERASVTFSVSPV